MFKVRTFNAISVSGLERFARDKYEVASEIGSPDGIVLRSHKLQMDEIDSSVKAIGRAGAGTNNIDVGACTDRGVVVFNAPGANANAVKELVVCAMLMGSRDIAGGVAYSNSLDTSMPAKEMSALLEKEKKRFKGTEILGKTLGVVGLGAIGSMVADAALALGMNVVGYDPALSVEAAWRLPNEVTRMENLQSLMARSDFVTLHLPVLDATRGLINAELLSNAKSGLCLINFAREEIVDTDSVAAALSKGDIRKYVADFPSPQLIGRDDVVLMPHIGASTAEAEDNCAIMVADQLKDFLENGNIKNSVNFPNTSMDRTGGFRLAVTNKNVPKTLSNILAVLSDADINVIDLINKSRDDIAYNLIDTETELSQASLEAIAGIEGVINVRSV